MGVFYPGRTVRASDHSRSFDQYKTALSACAESCRATAIGAIARKGAVDGAKSVSSRENGSHP